MTTFEVEDFDGSTAAERQDLVELPDLEPDILDELDGSADVERQDLVELPQLEVPVIDPVLALKLRDGDARWETGEIPQAVRDEVYARDGGICRFCGTAVENPALHHVQYRSEGGLNVPANLISVHWMYAPRCHERIHDQKRRWQQLGLAVAATPGVTMLQLDRWQRRRAR